MPQLGPEHSEVSYSPGWSVKPLSADWHLVPGEASLMRTEQHTDLRLKVWTLDSDFKQPQRLLRQAETEDCTWMVTTGDPVVQVFFFSSFKFLTLLCIIFANEKGTCLKSHGSCSVSRSQSRGILQMVHFVFTSCLYSTAYRIGRTVWCNWQLTMFLLW